MSTDQEALASLAADQQRQQDEAGRMQAWWAMRHGALALLAEMAEGGLCAEDMLGRAAAQELLRRARLNGIEPDARRVVPGEEW